jgi:hypothetical protein
MKKLFTSILLLAATLGQARYASAGEPIKVRPEISSEVLPFSNNAIEVTPPLVDVNTPYMVKDTITNDTWTSLGYGTFNDVAVSSVYNVSTSGPFQVEVQQSVEHPGYYRLVNPYGTSKWALYNNGAYRLRNEDNYLVFNATNPDKVIFVTTTAYNLLFSYTPLNVQLSSTVGELNLFDYGGTYGNYGTLKDGNIVFPAGYLYVYTSTTKKLYKTTSDWKISLPGAADYSLSIAIDHNCYADNQIPYTITAGADVKNIKTLVASGAKYLTSTANLTATVSYGTASTSGSHVLDAQNGTSFTTGTIEDGWISIFAVGHDDDLTLREGSVAYAFATKHNDSEWRDLGTTKFTDDSFGKTFLGSSTVPDEKNVRILQNIADPRRFRLVNAFATSSLSAYKPATMYDGTNHNHYTEIIVYRADSVVIPERPMGVTINGSKLSLLSYSAGTVTGRNITFATQGLRLGNNVSYYYANQLGGFKLVLPRFDVVVSVTSANVAVAGATVKIGDVSAVTDENGQATLSLYGLSGTVTVDAVSDASGYSGSSTFDVEEGNYDYVVPIAIGAATSIDRIAAPASVSDGVVYDLNGRRVSKPADNYIYIIDSKKTVIRK